MVEEEAASIPLLQLVTELESVKMTLLCQFQHRHVQYRVCLVANFLLLELILSVPKFSYGTNTGNGELA